MRFIVTIDMDNDAMRSSEGIGRALHNIAQKVRDGEMAGKVLDANGNSVGTFEFAKGEQA